MFNIKLVTIFIIFLRFLIITTGISINNSNFLNEDDEELLLKQLYSYNQDYISDVKDEYSRIVVEERQDEISVKIGILATYFRLFKKFVPWSFEEIGYLHIYPEPEYDFDAEVSKICLNGLENCLTQLISIINSTQNWLIQDNFNLDELSIKTTINNQRIGMEISASQILCFMTNSRVPAFESIPYCSFDVRPPGQKSMKWTGKTFLTTNLIDEFIGEPFECATKSFCPDPCCSNVPEIVATASKYSKFCRLNRCQPISMCSLKSFENEDLFNMRQNKFNISCGCETPGMIYRPDIGECVHHDVCTKMTLCREKFQECLNTAGGYRCVCQLGYLMNSSNDCVPLNITSTLYHGFAHSEEIE